MTTAELLTHLQTIHHQTQITGEEAADPLFLRSLHRIVIDQNPAEVTAACGITVLPEDEAAPMLLLACRAGSHDGTLAGWTPVAAWQIPARSAADLVQQAASDPQAATGGVRRPDPAGFTIEGTSREFADDPAVPAPRPASEVPAAPVTALAEAGWWPGPRCICGLPAFKSVLDRPSRPVLIHAYWEPATGAYLTAHPHNVVLSDARSA